jgi:hypothetical protein
VISNGQLAGLAGRLALTLALTWCAWVVTTGAAASWHARRGKVESLERARQLDPAEARHAAALARARLASLDDSAADEAVALLEQAVALEPRDAAWWAELGAAYEFAGREADASRAYERAASLFPRSPQIAWQSGNFYLRSGRLAEALAAFRTTLEGDPQRRAAVFDLAWRSGAPDEQILERMIPERQDLLLFALDFLSARDRLESAGTVWRELRRRGWSAQPRPAFQYLDALLRNRRTDELSRVWQEVYPAAADGSNLVTNPEFRADPLGGGLDWRIYPAEGARAFLAPAGEDGARALGVEFDGRENLRYTQTFQYVPVEPGRRYRFRVRVRGENLTTDSGPRVEVFDADAPGAFAWSTTPVLGTAAWRQEELELRTGPATLVLVIRLARPPSRRFDSRIAGRFWFTDVRLEPLD